MMVGRWYVQLAAIWHWYLPLCIYLSILYVKNKKNLSFFLLVSAHSFCIFFFNLVKINQTE